MANKPLTVDGYEATVTAAARSAVLTAATIIGDLIEHIVVVGGLVPSLLVDVPPEGVDEHAGTTDVDLGLHFALLDDELYTKVSERFRTAHARPGKNAKGSQTPQSWIIDVGDTPITIDFLIGNSADRKEPTKRVWNLEVDFAAFVADAIPIAFHDKLSVTITGTTADGADATRQISVAGPGSFVILKALSWNGRGHPKDLYDLCWLLSAWADGVEAVAGIFLKLPDSPEPFKDLKQRALEILSRDFATASQVGPKRAAEFLNLGDDAARINDNFALVQRFLSQAKPKP